jgi:hypothetical protein
MKKKKNISVVVPVRATRNLFSASTRFDPGLHLAVDSRSPQTPMSTEKPQKPTTRDTVVQFIHTINVGLFCLSSLGFLFATNLMVPGVNDESLTAVKASGMYGLVYSIMLNSLGPAHHG